MMIMQQMQVQMRPQIESLFEPFPLAIVQLTKIKVWMDGSTDTALCTKIPVSPFLLCIKIPKPLCVARVCFIND